MMETTTTTTTATTEQTTTTATATTTTTATEPTTTKDYFVGVTIGEGSFGRVVHARHKASGKDVAIKVFDKASVRKRPNLLSSILTEKSLLLEFCSCPFVVSLWAAFHDTECLYLVMECAKGGNLQSLINSQGLLGNKNTKKKDWWRRTVAPHYALQLVRAVEYIHEKHVIHCDLSCSNILVTGRGRIQLADFGSAIRLAGKQQGENINDANSKSTITCGCTNKETRSSMRYHNQHQATILGGTVDYASPEILRGTSVSELCKGVDIWSLGCIFAALQLGESPFHAASDALALESIMNYSNGVSSPPLLLLLDKDHHYEYCQGSDAREIQSQTKDDTLPEGWRDLIVAMLHPQPNKRLGVESTSENHRQDRMSSSSMSSLSNQIRIPGSESIDLDVDPPVLPPEPNWVHDARSATMRDGSHGWISFLL